MKGFCRWQGCHRKTASKVHLYCERHREPAKELRRLRDIEAKRERRAQEAGTLHEARAMPPDPCLALALSLMLGRL